MVAFGDATTAIRWMVDVQMVQLISSSHLSLSIY
jgi:hypothetical protein